MSRTNTLPKITEEDIQRVEGGKWALIYNSKDTDKMVVSKSNPLLMLGRTKLTLTELKILDIYLGRINPMRPAERFVRIEKGELEKTLGVKRILKARLDQTLTTLICPVEIEKPNGEKGCIALFSSAFAKLDEDGTWQVNLACSNEAMEYIFNVENFGYLQYRLKNVINLRSRYSYLLYLYIEHHSFRGTWKVTAEQIKYFLDCEKNTYDSFYRFNGMVLKPAMNEINEKTTTKCEYHMIKKGREVQYIEFTYIKQGNMENQKEVERSDVMQYLIETVSTGEKHTPFFTKSELSSIRDQIIKHKDKIPIKIGEWIASEAFQRLMSQYDKMDADSEENTIRDPQAYYWEIFKRLYDDLLAE